MIKTTLDEDGPLVHEFFARIDNTVGGWRSNEH